MIKSKINKLMKNKQKDNSNDVQETIQNIKEALNVNVYTLKDLSKMLRITERTLINYLRERVLEGQKVKGTWFITEKNLNRFLNGE